MAPISLNSRAPLGRLAVSAIGLEIFLGVGAIGGGAALMLGPRGEIIPLPISALAGTPFGSYLVPGLILFTVLGVGPLGAAALAWRRHPIAPLLAFGVGLALLIWIVAQIALIGYSSDPPLQAVYLGLGFLIALVSLGCSARWARTPDEASANECDRGAPRSGRSAGSKGSPLSKASFQVIPRELTGAPTTDLRH